nr:hypothetical protein GCM10017745_71740 [Saccharothrix mutabilis subsp. capreolus]
MRGDVGLTNSPNVNGTHPNTGSLRERRHTRDIDQTTPPVTHQDRHHTQARKPPPWARSATLGAKRRPGSPPERTQPKPGFLLVSSPYGPPEGLPQISRVQPNFL